MPLSNKRFNTYTPDIPLMKVSTNPTIFFNILSPMVLRCNRVGFSPSSNSSKSSRIGSFSEYKKCSINACVLSLDKLSSLTRTANAFSCSVFQNFSNSSGMSLVEYLRLPKPVGTSILVWVC